jgi:hypothetical protein
MRERIRKLFINKEWVSNQECTIQLEYYLILMKHHYFNLSPRGISEESFRTWESLYFGIIPIVIKNEIYRNFTDLPIFQLDTWKSINEDVLKNTIEDFENKTWNYDKLNFNHWKNMVISDIKNLD